MTTQTQNRLPNAQGSGAPDVTDVDEVRLATDPRPIIRLGIAVLVLGFGCFLLWAAWAPLDEGVATAATVSIETQRKTIQHLQGGVVEKVLVTEGQRVEPGHPLVILDEAATRAAHEAIRQNYLAQRALESRLIAELEGAARVAFHSDLTGATESAAAQHMAVQKRLFEARRASQQAELAAARQSILGLERQASGLRQTLEAKRAQETLLSRQLQNVRALADEGFAPRNQALQLEQAQAELRAAAHDLATTEARALSAIAETRLRIAQRENDYLKEASEQLASVRREVQANQERLGAISAELARTQILAPVGGQVIGLAVSGQGAVVTPGQRLMDIVPQGEVLLLDAKVPPQVIDRVAVGEDVEVRFTAFADSPQLVVHGQVKSVSGDAVTEQTPAGNQTYYLARVALTPEGQSALGRRSIQPGMTAEVLIKTGERSLLTYLLHPLLKRIAAAMTEE